MSTPIDHGGPAFPEVTTTYAGEQGDYTQYVHSEGGMTLRDYFAAKAMHQFLRGAVIPVGHDPTKDFSSVATIAYAMADAMLRARGRQ